MRASTGRWQSTCRGVQLGTAGRPLGPARQAHRAAVRRPATGPPGRTGARSYLNRRRPELHDIDGWIVDRVLGGEQPNAADLQIGSTLRLLASLGDIAPLINERPAQRLIGLFWPLSGSVPAGVLAASADAAR